MISVKQSGAILVRISAGTYIVDQVLQMLLNAH